MAGSLYVVATPIGNLADLGARAREVLAAVDTVVAEDTRHTGRLLAHFGIEARLKSFHEHSGEAVVSELLERLHDGADLALVSDAGTPLVSDPGFELVRAARRAGLEVLPVPGPSAALAALSVSGLPPDRFRFCGFPPAKAGARSVWLEALSTATETLLIYESARRIGDTLVACGEAFGAGREAFLAREMTKLHEQYRLATLEALAEAIDDGSIPARGEFCLAVAGRAGATAAAGDEDQARRLLALLVAEMPPSRAARIAAAHTGVPRKQCYALAERLKSGAE